MKTRLVTSAVLAALACIPFASQATDGYFSHAYGLKSLGMGGAGIAIAQETDYTPRQVEEGEAAGKRPTAAGKSAAPAGDKDAWMRRYIKR